MAAQRRTCSCVLASVRSHASATIVGVSSTAAPMPQMPPIDADRSPAALPSVAAPPPPPPPPMPLPPPPPMPSKPLSCRRSCAARSRASFSSRTNTGAECPSAMSMKRRSARMCDTSSTGPRKSASVAASTVRFCAATGAKTQRCSDDSSGSSSKRPSSCSPPPIAFAPLPAPSSPFPGPSVSSRCSASTTESGAQESRGTCGSGSRWAPSPRRAEDDDDDDDDDDEEEEEEEEQEGAGCSGAAACARSCASRRRRTAAAAAVSVLPSAKQSVVLPPGGAWMRVVERPVMTLPLFWFVPLAYALADGDAAVFSPPSSPPPP